MQGVRVNGSEIPEAAILAEIQNHPASSPDEAQTAAAEALVVRELLLQEAQRLDLSPDPQKDDAGRRESDDEALVRQVLEVSVNVPAADDTVCQRYYENNLKRFQSPDLFEAAHILFAARPEETGAYEKAGAEAERTIAQLEKHPDRFAALAKDHSDCTSATNGGSLGQVALGDTVPEFETFLVSLDEGQICPVPVKTRFGAHVLRVDKKIPGRTVPFEMVKDRIADYLHEASWRRGAAQFVKLLAGSAKIEGVEFEGVSSPLVQ